MWDLPLLYQVNSQLFLSRGGNLIPHAIQDDLEFIKIQLARLPTRNEVCCGLRLNLCPFRPVLPVGDGCAT